MDKQITPSPVKKWMVGGVGIISAVILAAAYGFYSERPEGRYQTMDASALTFSRVKQGEFSERLSVRAQVIPKTTVFLDTLEGGRVEERLVEQGAFVAAGQPLVRLANTNLQMEVMSREAQVAEQLNFLRNTQMEMETNRLNLKRDLLEIDLNINNLQRKIKQYQPLVKKSVMAQDQLEETQENLRYYQARKQLSIERQQQEETIRQVQIQQLQESATMLQKNLKMARKNLENLVVKAPVAGYLSDLSVDVGASKSQGARLGQIDVPNEYKLQVSLDEFYLNRVHKGLPVSIALGDTSLQATVSKVDGRVVNSEFTLEIQLPTLKNPIKRGQSVNVDLLLSEEKPDSVMLKRGAFYASTGGRWVFVVDETTQQAVRRNVTLGKKNSRYYEVLSGLVPNERVITSSYQHFEKADVVVF